MEKYSVILSAYECSPDHGSEAGLGWNWVMAASKFPEFERVHVITMDRYQENIDKFLKVNRDELKNVVFHLVSLPMQNLPHLNQRFKYILWQKKILPVAKDICEQENIAFIHHVTWATCVFSSNLYKCRVPFVYGPVGGGERIPNEIDLQMSKRDRVVENIRNLVADVSMMTFAKRKCLKKASLILTTTDETRKLIGNKYKSKTAILQSIGINELPKNKRILNQKNFTILMAGRMLCWKGFDIAIDVMNLLRNQDNTIKLLIAGGGRNEKMYRDKAKDLRNIEFLGNLSFAEMQKQYAQADVLLNCSLHDSGCMVVLEALSYGIPIVAIDTGGPHVLLGGGTAGVLIKPDCVSKMVENIADVIIELKNDRVRLKEYSQGAIVQANKFQFELKYEAIVRELKSKGVIR